MAATGPTNKQEEGSVHPKTTAAIEAWKRNLLDLTKRNRALNFAPNKVSTVTVGGEDPAAVFQRLCLRDLTMRLQAGQCRR